MPRRAARRSRRGISASPEPRHASVGHMRGVVQTRASADDGANSGEKLDMMTALQRIEALMAGSERNVTEKRIASQSISGLLAETQQLLSKKVTAPA